MFPNRVQIVNTHSLCERYFQLKCVTFAFSVLGGGGKGGWGLANPPNSLS